MILSIYVKKTSSTFSKMNIFSQKIKEEILLFSLLFFDHFYFSKWLDILRICPIFVSSNHYFCARKQNSIELIWTCKFRQFFFVKLESKLYRHSSIYAVNVGTQKPRKSRLPSSTKGEENRIELLTAENRKSRKSKQREIVEEKCLYL